MPNPATCHLCILFALSTRVPTSNCQAEDDVAVLRLIMARIASKDLGHRDLRGRQLREQNLAVIRKWLIPALDSLPNQVNSSVEFVVGSGAWNSLQRRFREGLLELGSASRSLCEAGTDVEGEKEHQPGIY
jgi:hypothetical protein